VACFGSTAHVKPFRGMKSAALAAGLAFAQTAFAASGPDAGPSPETSPAGLLFGQKCTSCHTIGEGNKIGPDLLGVDQRRELPWLRRTPPRSSCWRSSTTSGWRSRTSRPSRSRR